MKLSIELPQEWQKDQKDHIDAYETMTCVAQEAERLGFYSVWLFDHVHSPASSQPTEQMIFECWTSTAALARDTKRIRIGQLVTNNSFRHPMLIAKMASTVDVLSHGRLTLGIGGGWYEPEYLAYGYSFPDTAIRLRQLRESIKRMKVMWSEEEGYFQVCGANNHSQIVQQPHIPLLIGGKGERVTLKLVAQYGDSCNLTHPTLEELAHKFALIRRYCEEIGRNEKEIHRTIYVNCFPGETEAEALALFSKAAGKLSLEHVCTRGLFGTPEMIRQHLIELEQYGVQEVIISRRSILSEELLSLFARCMS